MNEAILILERSLRSDLKAIDTIYEALGTEVVQGDEPQDALIVKAYYLHNLYSASENMFRAIAGVLENQIEDTAGWHSELLHRMTLDLSPLRPAVIDGSAHEKLDELRRFRHFFRTAYGVPLSGDRFALAQKKALALRSLLRPQIESFLGFLAALRSEDSD